MNGEALVALFLSGHENKVDSKGRVSVPAAFRAALAGASLVLFRSHAHQCLEGFDLSVMEEISQRLDHFDLFSADQDDMATAIFGEAVQLQIDNDGRMVLPAALLEYAGIDGRALFVGMGRKFQVWQPDAFAKRREEARRAVKDKGLTLPRGES